MSDFISAAKEKLLVWWLAGIYAALFSCVSLAGAWMTATAGVDWTTLGLDAKIRVGVGCFSVWGTTMMAFINRAMSRVKTGELPVAEGDMQILSRTTVASETKTIV